MSNVNAPQTVEINGVRYVAEAEMDAATARHKSEQYDDIVRALNVTDGGRYRYDTIESVIAAKRRIAKLEAELAEAAKDTARLNKVERQRGRCQVWEFRRRQQSSTCELATFNAGSVERDGSIRAAIDAIPEATEDAR